MLVQQKYQTTLASSVVMGLNNFVRGYWTHKPTDGFNSREYVDEHS